MRYRPLGLTGLHVSTVGFGTCQLRLKGAQQAIDTLKHGFRLGVNIVHTAPDYEGADDLVAEAVRESGCAVIVASQGYGDPAHFEYLFEETCRKLGKRRLELFGIAAVEDRVMLGENVYGAGGMVEFLTRKKAEGRLGATFCTTHGAPEEIARLITGGHFDAVMLAYNALGFHLLSYYPQPPVQRENLPRNGKEIFPLAVRHGVGLMAMKPLAGGLLCRGRAFPPRAGAEVPPDLRAGDVLRALLQQQPEISCVLPGTALVEEAEENALAGHEASAETDAPRRTAHISRVVGAMPATICSRCGACDELCSQNLPVSWLFRDGYISHYPSETFETLDQLQYFHLHTREQATCASCLAVTCACPYGIDIPASLIQLHGRMLKLRADGVLPVTPEQQRAAGPPPGPFLCRVISRMFPEILLPGESVDGAFWVQNESTETWRAPRLERAGCALAVFVGEEPPQITPLRHDAEPGTRTHFALTLRAPDQPGEYSVRAVLVPAARPWQGASASEIIRWTLTVAPTPQTSQPMHPAEPPPPPLAVRYHEHNIPAHLSPKRVFGARIEPENTGHEVWLLHHPVGHRVDLFIRWGNTVAGTIMLPRAEVPPGGRVVLHFPLRVPDAPGSHELTLDMVQQNVATFSERGSPPLRLSIEVPAAAPTVTRELYDFASRVSPWYYQPTRGIDGAGEGDAAPAFPLFVTRASGPHFWDAEGRQYLDYVMGWGCALLGYAPPEVQRAIVAETESAAVVPFPHPHELEVARQLTEDIPCAEMVIFGKHGSDACTVAARLSRSFTGRNTILFCGYHGWQDWWMQQLGFAATGIPEHARPILHRFRPNDLEDFKRLFEEHRADLAGVMLEPAGAVAGPQGPSPDADAGFLRAVADLTHEAGAVLTYDEIMTGFRYPGGSVQAATGVVPDLACFGKALGGGLSLSALVGRRQILERCMGTPAYGPTFKGEVYPFVAARTAINIYRREPVADHVWRYGQRLGAGMLSVAADHRVPASIIGPPFRTALAFAEPDPERLRLKRTLWQQELLRGGVHTYNGFFLPSYAHRDAEYDATMAVVDHALAQVAAAGRTDDFHRRIEIPLV